MKTIAYPKREKKKKRKTHKESVLQKKDGVCYLCALGGKWYIHENTEEHHVFGGPNRIHSEEEGLKVWLCPECHRGPDGVHNNIEKMRLLQREAQKAYEKTHSREQFVALIGRNYLDEY